MYGRCVRVKVMQVTYSGFFSTQLSEKDRCLPKETEYTKDKIRKFT